VNRAITLLALSLAALVGCNDDIDQPWELDHDRIIAVRAEPPAIEPGETSTIDVLVGYEKLEAEPNKNAEQKRPDFVSVVTPMSLADTVRFDGDHWIVTAPSEARMAAVRAELGLRDDEPIELRLGIAVAWPNKVMSPDPRGFGAIKTVWLGREGINPLLNGITLDGVEMPADQTEIVFPKGDMGKDAMGKAIKTRLAVEADEETDIINWLSSCGEVHDFDLPSSYVTFSTEDRTEGQFALVLRDPLGGVSWRVWNCRVE